MTHPNDPEYVALYTAAVAGLSSRLQVWTGRTSIGDLEYGEIPNLAAELADHAFERLQSERRERHG